MSLNVYGLKNCDTCRKARKWLDANDKVHVFKDLRSDGFDVVDLQRWLDVAGWEILLNKRGTTWRGLDDTVKENVNADNIANLLIEHPALMKRPIFDFGDKIIVGFTAKQQAEL